MKLKKYFISIPLIIVLVLLLIIFSFVLISKRYVDNNYVKDIADKFDLKSYLFQDEKINNSILNYNYPKEVYNYIDENKVLILKKKFYSNLISNNNVLIDKKDIKVILDNSVYEYENITHKDVYNNVCVDIDYISTNLSEYINEKLLHYHNFFLFIGSNSFYYFLFITCIILFILLILLEGINGIFISFIISFSYSFYLYYINNNFYDLFISSFNNNYLINYFREYFLLKEESYIICFIFSFVLLLICIVNYLKKIIKEIKVSSY